MSSALAATYSENVQCSPFTWLNEVGQLGDKWFHLMTDVLSRSRGTPSADHSACAIVHMTSGLPSLINVARRSSSRSISRPILSITPTTSIKFLTIRKMSDAIKGKSEEEWRAVLSPEQVRSLQCAPITSRMDSLAYMRACMIVQGAAVEGYRARLYGGVRA
jgi:hypothetical protein